MERKIRRRNGIVRCIKNLIGNIEELLQNDIDDSTREQIIANKTLIKEKEIDLKTLQEEIINEIDNDEEYDKELDTATEFELKIRTLEEKIKKKIETTTVTVPQQQETRNVRSHENTVKLPKLEIKKFGGEPTEWTQFLRHLPQLLTITHSCLGLKNSHI